MNGEMCNFVALETEYRLPINAMSEMLRVKPSHKVERRNKNSS